MYVAPAMGVLGSGLFQGAGCDASQKESRCHKMGIFNLVLAIGVSLLELSKPMV